MLKLSKNTALTDVLDQKGKNSILTKHPLQGSVQTIPLYLFNTDNATSFENVIIYVTNTDWLSVSVQPNSGFVGEINIGTIAGVQSKPFYLKVASSVMSDVQDKSDLFLFVKYD